MGVSESSVTRDQVKKHVADSCKDVSGSGLSMLIFCAIMSGISYWLILSGIEAGFILFAFVGGAIVLFFLGISHLVKVARQKRSSAQMSEDEVFKFFSEETAIRSATMQITKTIPAQKNVTVNILAYEVHKAAQGIFDENPFADNDGLLAQLKMELQSAAKAYLAAQNTAEGTPAQE